MKKLIFAIASLAVLCSCGAPASKTTKSGLDPQDFVSEYNGMATALYTLTNSNGMEVCITNFGGRIVSIMVPDVNGDYKDVVLGFDKVADYFPENNSSDFGASIGRYANRINQGKITLDGVEYQLPQNNFGHCLHGGPTGWQYQVYEVLEADANHVKMLRNSPDGDNNFPGNVKAYVTFTLTEENAIDIKYEATTDKTTVINMTNHSYFNLAGDPADHSVVSDYMLINGSGYTPIDDTCMTSGEIAAVEGTPFDFKTAKLISDYVDADDIQIKNANGIDHNWVLDTERNAEVPAVQLLCPETGILLTVYTDEPGMQVYTGNFLDGTVTGKKGVVYNFRHGICFESQKYPDTPNKPQWPSAELRPGETYNSRLIYQFSVMKPCCQESFINGTEMECDGSCEK